MTIELIDGTARLALGAIAIVALAIAFGLWRRGARTPVTLLLCVAYVTGGIVAVEALVALTVRIAAPSTTDFNEFRWILLAPWRHRGLWLGGAAVVAIAALAWRASRGAGPARRAALVTLRTSAAAIALVVFLQPAVELRQVAREPNRVAILVDDSRSMGLRETPKGPTRTERVRALLDASGPALDAWRGSHQLDVYTFSDAVASASLERVATTEPTGNATLVRKALEAIRARYDERDLAGVVLISDGAGTGDFDADRGDGALRDFLRSLDTRVHTVWAARPGLRDVAVSRVLADEFAFVRTVVRLEAVIRSTGYGPRRVTVSLSSDGKVVRQKEVDLIPGETTVVFEVTPPRVGRYLYEISVPVADDEAVAANNARAFVIRVIRDKIRVLQVAGAPSWDVRALRAMLEENPNVDLISFFILRTQDSISMVPNDEMSLIPFPTRELFEEELPSFDLIVLQNFEFMPYGIGDYLENIRSYVDGGGGLAMLGGTMSFSSGGYHGTPVAAALPVELIDPWTQQELVDTRPFAPELTDAGKTHPVTALRYAVSDNLAAWKALPGLEGVNLIAGPRPDATVLAVHPKVKTPRGKPMPVIVAGDYGKGKTLAITTDSLWKWGFVAAARPGDDGRAYTRLWENAIRWLIQDPDLRNLHVDSDAVEYVPGQPVVLRVRLSGRDYQPLAGGKVTLVWKKGADPASATAVGTAQVTVGDDGTGTHELRGLAPGAYRVEASAEVAGKQATAGDIFLARDASAELEQPAGDLETLARVAAGTGGRALGPVDVLPADLAFDAPRVVRVDRRADVELWSRPLLILLAFLVLGLEWLLRQRSGYL